MSMDRFIIKNHHKDNYTTVYNRFFQDKGMNLELKGFGGYILSLPSDWIINPAQLSFDLEIGKDKIMRLINCMIELGYMYRYKKDITFAKKGELKNTYYFCDDKELLNKTTQIFRRDETTSQLPLYENPPLLNTVVENTSMDIPMMENSLYTNNTYYKKNIEKEENNKKNTILTDPPSIRSYLKEILDDRTIVTLLSIKPDFTIEEFNDLYKKANDEFKAGYCNNINAYLVEATKGKWKFRHNISNFNNATDKDHRTLKSRVNYAFEYFKITGNNKDEILSNFLKENEKYDSELISFYYNQLKEKLESN